MSTVNLQKFLKKHKSGWIALTPDNKKEVASGKTLSGVLRSAKKRVLASQVSLKYQT